MSKSHANVVSFDENAYVLLVDLDELISAKRILLKNETATENSTNIITILLRSTWTTKE